MIFNGLGKILKLEISILGLDNDVFNETNPSEVFIKASPKSLNFIFFIVSDNIGELDKLNWKTNLFFVLSKTNIPSSEPIHILPA